MAWWSSIKTRALEGFYSGRVSCGLLESAWMGCPPPEYPSRQEDYIRAWHENTFYTPELEVNGKTWHGWRNKAKPSAAFENPGILKVEVSGEFHFFLRFESADSSPDLTFEAHVALLGFGIESEVTSEENAGRILRFLIISTFRLQKNPRFHFEWIRENRAPK